MPTGRSEAMKPRNAFQQSEGIPHRPKLQRMLRGQQPRRCGCSGPMAARAIRACFLNGGCIGGEVLYECQRCGRTLIMPSVSFIIFFGVLLAILGWIGFLTFGGFVPELRQASGPAFWGVRAIVW